MNNHSEKSVRAKKKSAEDELLDRIDHSLPHRRGWSRSDSERMQCPLLAKSRRLEPAASWSAYSQQRTLESARHSLPQPRFTQAFQHPGHVVPLAVGRWCNFRELGCHLGNVGLTLA